MARRPAKQNSAAADWQDKSAREFAYSWADFEQARRMIRERAGVSLADHKHHLVYSRLSKRIRMLGKTSVTEYLAMLESDSQHPEWQDFTSSLTTHLTSFFREPHHFELLASILHERRGKPLRIWCAAASTGEEPYSIAMTAVEAHKRFDHPVHICATDIDLRGLASAEAGVYPLDRVQRLSSQRLKQFFQRGAGSNQGLVRVRREVRDSVRFFQLNLLDSHWPIEGRFDVIFCRNVMIYFEKEDQTRLIERLVTRLNADGVLILGHSENAQCLGKQVKLVGKTAYQLVPSASRTKALAP